MSRVEKVHYQDDKSIRFSYTVNKSGYLWSDKSPNFFFDKDLTMECFFTMSCESKSNNTYNYSFKLSFVQSHSWNNNDLTYETIVCFDSPNLSHNYGCIFLLTQDPKDQKNFISKNFSLYDNSSSTYLNSNLLKLNIKISCINKLSEAYKLLSDDLGKMLGSQENTDLELKVDNNVFKVHKCVLAARSNVLAKMIESDMIEKNTGEIILNERDPVAVKEMLVYIYSGICDLTKEPYELLKLADYFELIELKERCKEFLMCNVNFKNVVNILAVLDLYQDDLNDLRDVTQKFINSNEPLLAIDSEFQEYLSSNLTIKNLPFVTKMSYTYKLKDLWNSIIQFFSNKSEELFRDNQCYKFFKAEPEIMLQILQDTSSKNFRKRLRSLSDNE